MVQPRFAALARRLQLHVHADDVVVGNVHHALDEHAADEAVGAGAYIAGEAVVLQVFDDLHHRQVEGAAVDHALEAVHFPHEDPGDEIGKLVEGHARVSPGRLHGVAHRHIRGEGVVQGAVPQQPAHLQHLGVRMAVRVLEDAPGQHIVFQIRGVQFAHQGAVHIEHGNAVHFRDVIRGFRVRHRLHVVHQGVQGRGFGVPLGEVFLLRWFGRGDFPGEGRACDATQRQQHAEQGAQQSLCLHECSSSVFEMTIPTVGDHTVSVQEGI